MTVIVRKYVSSCGDDCGINCYQSNISLRFFYVSLYLQERQLICYRWVFATKGYPSVSQEYVNKHYWYTFYTGTKRFVLLVKYDTIERTSLKWEATYLLNNISNVSYYYNDKLFGLSFVKGSQSYLTTYKPYMFISLSIHTLIRYVTRTTNVE